VRERIHRGHIDVNVNVQPGAAVPVQVNRDLLQRTRNPRKRFGVSWEAMPASTSYPLRLPGVIGGLAPPLPETDEEQDQLGKALDTALREALLKLDDMRHAEGRHLAEELRTRVALIGQQADQVRDLAKALTRPSHGGFKRASKTLEWYGHRACSSGAGSCAGLPSAVTSAKNSIACAATCSNLQSFSTAPANSARNWIFCCRRCIAKQTPCCRRLLASKLKR